MRVIEKQDGASPVSTLRVALRAGVLLLLAVLCGLALSCGPNRPMADAPQVHHAQVELLADPATVRANGTPSWLGVHFKLDPGWHIYWQNPGDSGQPPEILWKSRNDKSAFLRMQWPRPERLNSTGASLMDYGYRDDVLLLIPVSMPPEMTNANLSAEAKYLICREVCIPEKADLRLALPAANNQQTAELFGRARNQLPKLWPAEWKAMATERKDDFLLSIDIGRRLEKADFFPLEAEQIENAAPQVLQPASRGATITLKKSDQLLKPVAGLRGVLVLGDEAYRVEAPVTRR